MSYYDYQKGKEIELRHYPFYAIIQAAMRQADNINEELLKRCWPEVWDELGARYARPGGLLFGEHLAPTPESVITPMSKEELVEEAQSDIDYNDPYHQVD